MNKPNHLRMAALFATALLLTSIGSVHAGLIPTTSCAKSDDDAGFGGTHVECDAPLACPANAELLIAAFAGDQDAKVSGDYNCGKTSAACPSRPVTCEGASGGLTSIDGEGTCEAESDEFWSSTVTVACATIGGTEQNPTSVICKEVPSFPTCGGNSTGGGGVPRVGGGGGGGGPEAQPPRALLDSLAKKPHLLDLKADTPRSLCTVQAIAAGIEIPDSDYDKLFPSAWAGYDITGMRSTIYYADQYAVSFLYAYGNACEVTQTLT